jgi:hypothetical protein
MPETTVVRIWILGFFRDPDPVENILRVDYNYTSLKVKGVMFICRLLKQLLKELSLNS